MLQQFALQAAEHEDGFDLSSSQGSPPPVPAGPARAPAPPAVGAVAAAGQAASCMEPLSAGPVAPQARPQATAQAEAPGSWILGGIPVQVSDGTGQIAIGIGNGAAPGASASPCASAAAQPCSSGDSSAAPAGLPDPEGAAPPGAAGVKRQRSGQEECSSVRSAAVKECAPTVRGSAGVPSDSGGHSGPALAGSGAAAAGTDGGAGGDSEERKRQARMARNRESALHSRQRKKMQADELERRCDTLQADNRRLAGDARAAI